MEIADTFILSWLTQPPSQQLEYHIAWPARDFQEKLIYAYRTAVARGQASTSRRTRTVLSVISAVTQPVFTKRGLRARGCGVREPDHTILANLLFPCTREWR